MNDPSRSEQVGNFQQSIPVPEWVYPFGLGWAHGQGILSHVLPDLSELRMTGGESPRWRPDQVHGSAQPRTEARSRRVGCLRYGGKTRASPAGPSMQLFSACGRRRLALHRFPRSINAVRVDLRVSSCLIKSVYAVARRLIPF